MTTSGGARARLTYEDLAAALARLPPRPAFILHPSGWPLLGARLRAHGVVTPEPRGLPFEQLALHAWVEDPFPGYVLFAWAYLYGGMPVGTWYEVRDAGLRQALAFRWEREEGARARGEQVHWDWCGRWGRSIQAGLEGE